MIIRLLNIQFARLKRQKIVYLFFVVMAVIIISNALQEDSSTANFARDIMQAVNFQQCVCSPILILSVHYSLVLSAQY